MSTCTTCGKPASPHPYRHPVTTMGDPGLGAADVASTAIVSELVADTTWDGSLRVPRNGLNDDWCRAWDGTELVCDLPYRHAPSAALPRDHRGHVQRDGRGPFLTVYFDADRHREPVVELPEPPVLPSAATWGCTDHQPKQHRDSMAPWCGLCGRTADGGSPLPPPPPEPVRHLPPPGTRVDYRDAPEGETPPSGVVVGPATGDPDLVLVLWDGQPTDLDPHRVAVDKLLIRPWRP